MESRSVFWNFLFSNPYRMILFFQVFNERGEKDRSRKIEIDGEQIAKQLKFPDRKPCGRNRDDKPTISTNKLHKLVLDNGIKLDEKEIKGVRYYSIKQDEDEMIAKLTLFMDVRII